MIKETEISNCEWLLYVIPTLDDDTQVERDASTTCIDILTSELLNSQIIWNKSAHEQCMLIEIYAWACFFIVEP